MKNSMNDGGVTGGLVEEALAAHGSAETGYAVGGVEFAFELVVVRELLVCGFCQYFVLFVLVSV